MAKSSVKRNYIYNVSYQILLLLTPLVTTPYISRVLGADNIGKYSYVNSISAYFTMFATLGITTYGQREISYIQQDREKRSTVLWEVKLIQTVTSIISAVMYLIFAFYQTDSSFYQVFLFNILAVIVDIKKCDFQAHKHFIYLHSGQDKRGFGSVCIRSYIFPFFK